MRRITTTLFGILAIVVIFYMMTQGGNMDIPWAFGFVAMVMIVVIILSIVRTWLQGS